MKGPCLLCLSSFSRGGKERELSSILAIIPIDYFENRNQFQNADRFVACFDCESLIISAIKLHAQICQLNVDLQNEIGNIRAKILATEKKEGKNKNADVLRMRQTFLERSGKQMKKLFEIVPINAIANN